LIDTSASPIRHTSTSEKELMAVVILYK